jgi:protein-L-isoaspartate(D-aspartate) O-methyltransferase
MRDSELQRRALVQYLRERGHIHSERVLAALAKVPRERFVEAAHSEQAYEDRPFPIPCGQTISQPWIVARMLELLKPSGDERALEVGCGSGYAAALLAQLARVVVTIERHAPLADTARERLRGLGFAEVEVRCGDGTLGAADRAPFDAILVSAGGTRIPPALKEQLRIGGRMVIPIGPHTEEQRLMRVTRRADGWHEESLEGVRFVPLVGS